MDNNNIITKNWSKPWGVYPNIGTSMPSKEGIIEEKLSTDAFKKEINNCINAGASVIGACCGSNPYYIHALRDLIDLYTKQ